MAAAGHAADERHVALATVERFAFECFSMNSWLRLSFVLSLAVFCASGCYNRFTLGAITVRVASIELPAEGSQAKISLRYINENVFPVAISRSTHKVYAGGKFIGDIKSNEPVGLPQLGTASQTVTVLLDNPAALREATSAGTFPYEVRSALYVESGDQRSTIKTRASGSAEAK